ncbi:hypothetical protein P8884_00380 [Bacillus haynesii]|nr:hypothetical protein [Bacillus haynesii]
MAKSIRKLLREFFKTNDGKEMVGKIDAGLLLNLELAHHEMECIRNKRCAFMRYLLVKGVDKPYTALSEKCGDEIDKSKETLEAAWRDIFISLGIDPSTAELEEYSISNLGVLFRVSPQKRGSHK